MSGNDSHVLDCVLLFQEHFESLVNDPILQGFDIPFILLSED